MKKIYLDHAATTPVHPRVTETMITLMQSTFGNPSSIHSFGRDARKILDESREILAKSIQADFSEIVFTSGGTEADNLAIIGTALANRDKGNHIITSKIEHHAVLNTCKYLEKEGFEVTYLDVDESGQIDLNDLRRELKDDTILVTIMHGNNEVGTIQPIKQIGQMLANHQAYFHTDAVQTYGIEPIHVKDLHVDLLSVSAHKINGPKGIGFLYIRNGTRMKPGLFGGEQELKRRAGTENIISIAGFQQAVQISQETMMERNDLYKKMKSVLIEVLQNEKIEFHVNGDQNQTLPHVMNISFPGTDVEAMLVNLDLSGIAVSSGSACTAGSLEPSHVLVAMFGEESERINNSIRFSFGLDNTIEDIQHVAIETAKIVRRIR